MKLKFIIIIFLLNANLLLAQSQISGIIVNQSSQEPLPFVSVTNLSTGQSTFTNEDGMFTIDAEIGVDSIKLNMVAYESLTFIAANELLLSMEPAILSLTQVVISNNRELEKRSEVPLAISSISLSQIQQNRPNSIDQIVNQIAGVNMVDLGNEQHTMSIRRPIDYGASYLYLEDGVPIRASGVFNHNALLEMNMATVSRIEVIRGPASSMYGSEAIGGALNFISRSPGNKPLVSWSARGNNIGYKRTDFYASNTFKNLGVSVGGYYALNNNGVREHTDFNKLALSLGLNYSLNKNTKINWSNTIIDYFSDMTGSLDSTGFFEKRYNSSQTFTYREVDALRSKLSINHYWNDLTKTVLTTFFRLNSIKQNPSYRVRDDFRPWIPAGDRNLAHGEENDNSFASYGAILQHRQELPTIHGVLIGGISLDLSPNNYEANYIRIFKNDEGVYESFTTTDSSLAHYETDLANVAAYSQLKVSPFKKLNVIGALRYDHFSYNFNNFLGSNSFTSVLDGTNRFYQFTPKVGVTYDLSNKGNLYANYATGFVPPQVTELYRGSEVPELKPVYYYNYEFGGKVALIKEKLIVETSLYRMDGINEIISVQQDDGSLIKQNAGRTRHEGIEYAVYVIPVKSLSFRLSGTNARHLFEEYVAEGQDYSGNEMPQSPSWIANAQLSYKPGFVKGLRMSLEWQHVTSYFMDPANETTYDGYQVFNFRVMYNLKGFDLWLNVINLTNEHYSTVARATRWGQSYSLGNPRNINVGIAYTFKGK